MPEREMSKAVEALLAGGKMLSIHCVTCKGPLFEREGRIFCPACGEEKRFAAKPESEPQAAPKSEAERILREKLDALTSKIEKETDHRKTLELLEEVKSILEVLQKLR